MYNIQIYKNKKLEYQYKDIEQLKFNDLIQYAFENFDNIYISDYVAIFNDKEYQYKFTSEEIKAYNK